MRARCFSRAERSRRRASACQIASHRSYTQCYTLPATGPLLREPPLSPAARPALGLRPTAICTKTARWEMARASQAVEPRERASRGRTGHGRSCVRPRSMLASSWRLASAIAWMQLTSEKGSCSSVWLKPPLLLVAAASSLLPAPPGGTKVLQQVALYLSAQDWIFTIDLCVRPSLASRPRSARETACCGQHLRQTSSYAWCMHPRLATCF